MKIEFINFESYLSDINLAHRQLIKIDFINRLFRKDFTIWKENDEEISNRLGWLDSPLKMEPWLKDYEQEAEKIRKAGFKLAVLLGMGGSSLGPEALSRLSAPVPGHPQFLVLDSTCPSAIKNVAVRTEKEPTLFIVSSKSGTTIETLSLFNYFFQQQQQMYGAEAGRHFIAITDPGTPLERIASQVGFRKIVAGFPEIGGRFSVLSPFGLFPAAVLGYDLEKLLAPAVKSFTLLHKGNYDHPGIKIGVFLGVLTALGKNKLTLVLPPELNTLGRWLEQLIAESTGKEGKEVLPVIENLPLSEKDYSSDRIFVFYDLEEGKNIFAREKLERLLKIKLPLLYLTFSPEEIAEHFYIWELATALIGYFLKINPFNQPDVELTKKKTREILPQPKSNISDSPELKLDCENFYKEFKAFLLNTNAAVEYLSLLAFLPPSENLDIALSNLARQLTQKTGFPCTWNYGPAYLHSTGQLHKGGSGKGRFLGLLFQEKEEVLIPSLPQNPATASSFNQLFTAQALADFSVLKERGRKVMAIKIEKNPVEEIFRLGEIVRNI